MKRLIYLSYFLIVSCVVAFYSNHVYAITFADLVNNAPEMNTDRNCNQDFSWTHNPVNLPIDHIITYAQIKIFAYDVDSDALDTDPKVIYAGRKEVDNIYAYDNGIKTYLGPLIGGSSVWEYTTFTLGSNFYDDIENGLILFLDSDALCSGTGAYWVVQIGSSEISGNAVPIPGALWLFGSGIIGLVGWRKFMSCSP